MGSEYVHAGSGLVLTVHEEAGGYYALVLALPGCGSQGDTEREALDNTVDALSAVLDVIREDDPERYYDLLGERVAASAGDAVDTTVPTAVWATG